MTPNAIHGRLQASLAEVEARVTARLDAIDAKLDRIMRAAGPAGRPAVEVLDVEDADPPAQPGAVGQGKPTRKPR